MLRCPTWKWTEGPLLTSLGAASASPQLVTFWPSLQGSGVFPFFISLPSVQGVLEASCCSITAHQALGGACRLSPLILKHRWKPAILHTVGVPISSLLCTSNGWTVHLFTDCHCQSDPGWQTLHGRAEIAPLGVRGSRIQPPNSCVIFSKLPCFSGPSFNRGRG